MSSELKGIPSGRVVSIDALRGFDMFWIFMWASFFKRLFNKLDGSFFNFLYGQLFHSKWHGFTFYDFIFPLFMFIVGLSMSYSFGKRIQRGEVGKKLYIHIIKRTLTLILLGLVYNGLFDFDFADLRYTGVLQRIAICYLFTALILLYTNIRTQVIITGLLLLIYWGAMALIPVPGYGVGVLTPEGNLAGYIDRLLVPGKLCCYKFGDHEGILATIPAVASTMIGLLTGHWLHTSNTVNKKLKYMIGAGLLLIITGLIWNFVFPFNKILWTSSYVVYAGGWSLLLFCLFYWIIDVKGYKKWAFPFIVIGLNPLTIFVVQRIFDFGIISDIFIHGFVDYFGSYSDIFRSFCVLLTQWLFLYFLYKKKIFLKA